MHKKTIPIFLIPILCLFTYQATKNIIASIQLNNASYFLQDSASPEIEKAQTALQKVQQLTPNHPDYHNLRANAELLQAITAKKGTEANIRSAQQHYRLGLQAQPDNPFLWSGLAKTDLAQIKQASSHNAMTQAVHYAPSDYTILSNAVLWTIPQWQHLNREQKQTAIEQLKLLVNNKKTNNNTRKQLQSLIKETGQHAIICSKLPRTKEFKNICF